MKQNNDWTDALRHHLQGAEAEPPADGWERIESELSKGSLSPAPLPTGKPKPVRRLWPAAAAVAVVLIAVGIGLGIWEDKATDGATGGNDAGWLASTPQEPEGAATADMPETSETTPAPLSSGLHDMPSEPQRASSLEKQHTMTGADGKSDDAESTGSMTGIGTSAGTHEPTGTPQADSTNESADTPQSGSDKSHSTPTKREVTPSTNLRGANPYELTPRKKAQHSMLALAVHESGLMKGAGDAFASPMPQTSDTYASLCSSGYYTYSPPAAAPALRSTEAPAMSAYQFRHNPELSLGMAVRWQPIRQMSVESGVVWSLLSSTVITGTTSRLQEVSYLGVPLYADWHIATWQDFSLYMGGGGMVERLLDARLGTWKADERPWQYSVGARLGISYAITPALSIDFEPHMQYHLTDTWLTTSRTGHPLTGTLRLSVCYHL